MVESWVLLGLGSGLILFGFLASLVFHRWRLPDFLILMLLGMALGPSGAGLVQAREMAAIQAVAPLFTAVAVAFLLFEGGVHLPLRGLGRPMVLILLHTFIVAALTVLGTWYVATHLFGLASLSGLVLGAAAIGPSASVVMSFAPRLGLDARTRGAVVMESVVTNVAAFLGVAALVQTYGPEASGQAAVLLGHLAGAVALAAVAGALWLRVTDRLRSRPALHMATLGAVLALYAVGEGPLGGQGAVAAFLFGLVMGNRGLLRRRASAEPAGDHELPRFHGEVTFFIRTFFFVYLGILFDVHAATLGALGLAVALSALFLAVRWPTATLLGHVWGVPARDTKVLRATVARGLSDAVVVLYGIEAGLVPALDAPVLTTSILLLVVVSALATAGLLFAAERGRSKAAVPAARLVARGVQRIEPEAFEVVADEAPGEGFRLLQGGGP